MRPLPVLEAAGTPGEIGLAHGRRFAAEVARAVERLERTLPRSRRYDEGLRRALGAGGRALPRSLDEVAGIAEGAGLPLEAVFRLNWLEGPAVTKGCTTIAVRTRRGILLAHNEDWARGANDLFVLRARTDRGAFVCLCYFGILPGISCGANGAGLVHAVNHLHPAGGRPGVPRDFVARAVLDARTIDEAVRIARTPGQGYGQSIHLAEGRRYANVETAPARSAVRTPPLPAVHANHYLAPEMRPVEGRRRGESTLARQWTAERLVAGLRRPTPAALRRVLASREGAPWCLYRDGRGPDGGATLATALLETGAGGLRVWRGRPDRGGGRWFAVP